MLLANCMRLTILLLNYEYSLYSYPYIIIHVYFNLFLMQINLQELLQAAGIESLDETSDVIDGRGRSFRQRGCILRVVIFYQNWFSTWLGTR